MTSNRTDYVKSIEEQNEKLVKRIEEHVNTIESLENSIKRADYAPVFAIQLNPDATYGIARNKPYYFVHPCLQSACEIIEDIVYEIIMTDVNMDSDKKTKKGGEVGHVTLDCWLLGSKERSFGVRVMKRRNKYHVALDEIIEEKIQWEEFSSDGSYYLSKLPTQETLLRNIYAALVDCQETHGVINKKEAANYVKV